MIFISHTHKDKDIIEPIALRLRHIFGAEKVFYDSWSIQPGDGIINRMNSALGSCRIFLFFVSNNSLLSNMVKLEWQNALMQSIGSDIKIIPVKLDACLMPPILFQSLYIDLFGQGLEVALRQIVDVTNGNNTFRLEQERFSNLRAHFYQEGNNIRIECHAEYYLEPISYFIVLLQNSENEVLVSCRSIGLVINNSFQTVTLSDNSTYNGKMLGIDRGTLPGFPFIIDIKPQQDAQIKLKGIMHQKRQDHWEMIPLNSGTN